MIHKYPDNTPNQKYLMILDAKTLMCSHPITIIVLILNVKKSYSLIFSLFFWNISIWCRFIYIHVTSVSFPNVITFHKNNATSHKMSWEFMTFNIKLSISFNIPLNIFSNISCNKHIFIQFKYIFLYNVLVY